MGRVKTKQEQSEKKAINKERAATKKLVLDLNDDVMYYKKMVQELSQEIIDFVNLAALTKKALLTDEGTEEAKKLVEDSLDKVIEAYLEGDYNNALTHKGADVEPETVKKVDKVLELREEEKNGEQKTEETE